jgi:hypothetical protein
MVFIPFFYKKSCDTQWVLDKYPSGIMGIETTHGISKNDMLVN